MLIQGNSFEILKTLDIIVDAIITDPPYNISKSNNLSNMGRTIDFGAWDYNFDITGWIPSALKLLKAGGNIVIFNDWKNLGDICKILETNGCIIKDMLRWEKTNPMPRNRDRRFIVDCEYAVWAVKSGAPWTFNRISDTYDRPKYMHHVQRLQGHPTAKPIQLMQDILLNLTNTDNKVLDPFMGSGSTGVACANTNRDFIGIELDQEYFKLAESRIN